MSQRFSPGLRVQARRRLVEEQHFRAVHQGAGDQQAAGLAAGERVGHRVAPVAEAEGVDQLRRAPARGAGGQAEELSVRDVQVDVTHRLDVAAA